jgi:hypothetical protein
VLRKVKKRIEIHENNKIEAIKKKTKDIKSYIETNNEIMALYHVTIY